MRTTTLFLLTFALFSVSLRAAEMEVGGKLQLYDVNNNDSVALGKTYMGTLPSSMADANIQLKMGGCYDTKYNGVSSFW